MRVQDLDMIPIRSRFFEKGGGELQFETKTKDEVAKDIVDTIIKSLLCLKEQFFFF